MTGEITFDAIIVLVFPLLTCGILGISVEYCLLVVGYGPKVLRLHAGSFFNACRLDCNDCYCDRFCTEQVSGRSDEKYDPKQPLSSWAKR